MAARHPGCLSLGRSSGVTNAEGQAFCIDCHSYFTLPTIPLKQIQAEAARLHQSKIKAALRDALGMLDILWKGDDIVPLREIEAFCEEIRELLIDGSPDA